MSDPLGVKGVSIERLRSFCLVVEHESIVLAAGDDLVRQSQFSRQIKELEQAMETRLFDRRNRRLIPTAKGRSLALLTRQYFDGLTTLAREGASQTKLLTVAAGESVLEGLILPRFRRLREMYPDYVFHFQNESTLQISQRLSRGEIGIAVVRESALNTDLASTFLGKVNYRLAVPRSLLPEGSIHGWGLVQGLPIAMLRGNGEFVSTLTKLAEGGGVHLTMVAECSTFSGLRELVRGGAAAAFLPEWMTQTLPSDRFVLFDDRAFKPLARTLYVVTSLTAQLVNTQLDGVRENLARIWRP